MPLAFETKSHGTIAVGFFNIESDMVLVGHYFLFASDLCRWIGAWAEAAEDDWREEREVYAIRQPAKLGNLHGAMQGWELSGFLGACYRRFPFPEERERFRQFTHGHETRSVMEQIIEPWATRESITVVADPVARTVAFGDFLFSRTSWLAVVDYLRQGGMPRWSAEGPPDYVLEMGRAVTASGHWLFRAAS